MFSASQFARLVFCSVLPGHEQEVAQSIIKLHPQCRPMVVLGDYDLAVLVPCDHSSFSDLEWPVSMPLIRERDEVLLADCGFTEQVDAEDLVAYGPALAFTMVKLDDSLLSVHGLRLEIALTHWIQQTFREEAARCAVYSTYGWAELLIMWVAQDYEVVFNAVNSVRNLTERDLTRSADRDWGLAEPSGFAADLSAVRYSYTLPCAEIEVFDGGEGATVPEPVYLYSKLVNVCGILPARLWLRTNPRMESRVISELGELPVDTACALSIMGDYDLLIEACDSASSGGGLEPYAFANLLSSVRGLGSEMLAGTRVELGRGDCFRAGTSSSVEYTASNRAPAPEEALPNPATSPRQGREGIIDAVIRFLKTDFNRSSESKSPVSSAPTVTTQDQTEQGVTRYDVNFYQEDFIVSELRDYEKSFDNHTLRFSSQLRQMLQRHEQAKAMLGGTWYGEPAELEGFLDRVVETVEDIIRNEPRSPRMSRHLRSTYDELFASYHLYNFALDQRISGARLGSANSGRTLTSLQESGIHRILAATRAVPAGLFRSLDPRGCWEGFTVFGFEETIQRVQDLAINLPSDALFRPGQWWGLVHEASHELMDAMGFHQWAEIEAVSNLAFNQLSSCDQTASRVLPRDQVSVDRVIEELFADLTSFLFGFNGDWNLFLRVFWRQIEDQLQGRHDLARTTQYVLRTAFVWFAVLEMEAALDPRQKVSDAIHRGWELDGRLYPASRGEMNYTESAHQADRSLSYRAFARYDSVSAIIEEYLVRKLIKIAPRIGGVIELVDTVEVAVWYESLERLRTEFLSLFSEYGTDVKSGKVLKNVDDAKKKLGAGQPVLDKTILPMEVLLALKYLEADSKHSSHPQSSNASLHAAILSLWHWNVTNKVVQYRGS